VTVNTPAAGSSHPALAGHAIADPSEKRGTNREGGPSTLPAILDTYMQRERLTLQGMADRTGLSLATVAALRSGSRGKRPRPETLEKLAAAMGTNLQTLEDAVGPAQARRERQLIGVFRQLTRADQALVEALAARLGTPYGG